MGNAASEKSKLKNDIIFIAVILAIIVAVGAIYIFSRAEGDTVTVTVDGKLYGEYSLSEDRTVEIKTSGGVNVLVIEGGRAHVLSATCPDGVCVSHKPVSREGESIICLPNKVVVSIHSRSEETPDIIV